MQPKPLPKTPKVLEILLDDCTQKLAAVSEVMSRDQDRLIAIEGLLAGGAAGKLQAARLSALTAAGSAPTTACVPTPTIQPYLDTELLAKIDGVRRQGTEEIQSGVTAFGNGKRDVGVLLSGFRRTIAANQALIAVLAELQRQIIDSLENGQADTKPDKQKKIPKTGNKQPLYYQLHIQLLLNSDPLMKDLDVAREFAAKVGTKIEPESLLRGVRRLRQTLNRLGL